MEELRHRRKKFKEERETDLFLGLTRKQTLRRLEKTSAPLEKVEWGSSQVPFRKVFLEVPNASQEDTERLKLERKQLGILTKSFGATNVDSVPSPFQSLDDPRLPEACRTFLKTKEAIVKPTPIQMQCW